MPRITMRDLLAIVAVVAIAAAWIRHLSMAHRSLCGLEAPAFDMGILGLGIVLALAAVATRRRWGRLPPFLLGFEAGGLAALAIFVYFARYRPDQVRAFLNPIYPIGEKLGFNPHADWYINVADTAMFLPPELALALLGGGIGWGVARALRGRGG